MTETEIIQLIQRRLGPFMVNFDNMNRGNRLSQELIIGLGASLEEFLIPWIKELTKGKPDEK